MLLCLAGTAVGGSETAPATDDDPVRVTTDSIEYCRHLAERLAGDRSIMWTADLRMLADMGDHMCRDGHLRMGIARLRRAWLMSHPDQ